MTPDDRQRLHEHDLRVAGLKDAYVRASQVLTAEIGAAGGAADEFRSWRDAGAAYFDGFNRRVVLGELTGVSREPAWYTDCAETAADLLNEVLDHYALLDGAAATLGLEGEVVRPNRRAFAAMQRLVRAADPEEAARLRDRFHAAGLPVHGFDAREAFKPGGELVEWRLS